MFPNRGFLLFCWLTIVVIVLSAGVSEVVQAADSAQMLKGRAKNYYYGLGERQDYRRALELYLQAAQLGDAEARYIAGGMLFKGQGGTADFQAAFRLLYEAASQGVSTPESQQILGQAFLVGSGVPKNYEQALYWYTKAAENGNAEAQNELGFMYFTGNGVEKDLEQGAHYFIEAAANGLVLAQYNAGILYYTGNGVPGQDLKKAYAWFNLAASKGHQASQVVREQLENYLTPDEIAEAQLLSESLLAD